MYNPDIFIVCSMSHLVPFTFFFCRYSYTNQLCNMHLYYDEILISVIYRLFNLSNYQLAENSSKPKNNLLKIVLNLLILQINK